jgi:MoaA/NifB/PqqE/SkfB family radical SAM enzyme
MSTELFSFFNNFRDVISESENVLGEYPLNSSGRVIRIGEIEKHRKILAKLRKLCLKYKVWFEDVRGPASAGIDVTYECNLKCPYCFARELGRSRRSMSKDKIFALFDELAEMGVMLVCLCGGEPTLRRDLFEIIRYGKDKGLHVNMVTNGTLIDHNYARNLADAGISSVQVSLDGSKAEIHDVLRGSGTFERVINAIKSLKEYSIVTYISFAATKLNVSDFPNVVELADKLGVISVRTMFYVPESREQLDLFPSDKDYEELISWIAKNRYEYPLQLEFGDPTEHIVIGPYISQLAVHISAEGYIMPSPYVNLAYGNIHLYSLSYLWKNGLQYIFRENEVFRTISSALRTERDFMKITLLLEDLISNKILPENEGYIDVFKLSRKERVLLSNSIRSILRRD